MDRQIHLCDNRWAYCTKECDICELKNNPKMITVESKIDKPPLTLAPIIPRYTIISCKIQDEDTFIILPDLQESGFILMEIEKSVDEANLKPYQIYRFDNQNIKFICTMNDK